MPAWFEGTDKETHQRLINQIMTAPISPLDHAAKNEIAELRKRIVELEKQLQPEKPKTTRTRKAKEE